MSSNTANSAGYLEEIDALFCLYLTAYPQDAARLKVLTGQINERDQTLNDRKNMIGHLTASALVLNDKDDCLLIYHKFLKRWLQPGGHLDPGESPLEGAMRELREETGVSSVKLIYEGPIDVDSHAIPASPGKGEGEHLHHDFQYIFRAESVDSSDSLDAPLLDQSEVSAFKWVSLTELGGGDYGTRLARVAEKIRALRQE